MSCSKEESRGFYSTDIYWAPTIYITMMVKTQSSLRGHRTLTENQQMTQEMGQWIKPWTHRHCVCQSGAQALSQK